MTKRADFKSVKSTFQNTPPNQVAERISRFSYCSFDGDLLIDMFVLCVQREVCRLSPGPDQRDGVSAFSLWLFCILKYIALTLTY